MKLLQILTLGTAIGFSSASVARAQVNLALGDLPPGQTAHIAFEVTIAPSAIGAVTNQGTVSADNLSTFVTDDPETGAVDDPTITMVGSSVPRLMIELTGGDVKLTWITPDTDWIVNEAGALGSPTIWSNLSLTPVVDGTTNTVTLPPFAPGRYYRLEHP